MNLMLGPKRLKEIDEINLDKLTSERTLEVALQYHSNVSNLLLKKEREWWENVAIELNLDLKNNQYFLDCKTGCIKVKVKEV